MGLLADTTTDPHRRDPAEQTTCPTPPHADPPGAAHRLAAAFVPNQSRAERTASFDVADFPLPDGPRGGLALHARQEARRPAGRGRRRASLDWSDDAPRRA